MKNFILSLFTIVLFTVSYQVKGQITGTTAFCESTATALSCLPPGGTWSSSDASVAPVNSFGVVSGVVSGTATITYTPPSAAAITTIVTVYPAVGALSGSPYVCAGSATTLGASLTGGTWSSSNPGVATVSGSGVLSGNTSGTSYISYTMPTGCYAFVSATVNPVPAPITTAGAFSLCLGSIALFNDATPGGIWVSSNPAVATVGVTGGNVTGISAPGVTNISYTLPTGCSAVHQVTVNSLPPAITGAATVCTGATTTFSDTPTGGLWTSSNTAVAIVGPTSGAVTGTGAGAAIITYMLSTGCQNTKMITVNPAPAAITGTTSICPGSTSTLTNATSGGTWTSGTPSIATIDAATGVVTSGSASGTTLISYTIATGCSITAMVTVNPLPLPISGPSSICTGSAYTFSSATPGGVWLSAATAIATTGTGTGSPTLVTGLTAGVTVISYISGAGCVTSTPVTVSAPPVAGTILGPDVVCIGSPAAMSETVTGGAWTSSAPGIASVSGTGVVSGFGTGSATIYYSVSNICGTASATKLISVNLPPGPISGVSELCGGGTTTLSDAIPGGTWTSSDISVAAIGTSSGLVTAALAGGITTISYSFSASCMVTKTLTIDPTPPAIGGVMPVCVGGVIALTDVLFGGIWSSSNPAVAIISTLGGTTGSVTGISAGTAFVTYGMTTGCMAVAVLTVNPLPAISVSATPSSCGGTWLASAVGGVSYMWSPSSGLSCTTCASPFITPSATTTYTVTGTGLLGCSSDATVIVDGNRIYGHVSFSAITPSSLGMRVWLIQYDAADSSLTATDSMITCLDGTAPFYEFSGKPSGKYMVRAQLLSSVPGTSNYVPTYGASSPNWFDAASTAHIDASDNQDINMIYGSVPVGSGFIGGHVYAGAGKGTSGDVPVDGMLVFLKSAATGQVLTYTYTDALGAYSFSGIAFGSYIIYPEEFSYYTTPSDVILLNESNPSKNDVNFKEHTTFGTITPMGPVAISAVTSGTLFQLYPNPASSQINLVWKNQATGSAAFILKDITGRIVLHTEIAINTASGSGGVDIANLESGVYFYNIQGVQGNCSGKLLVQKQ